MGLRERMNKITDQKAFWPFVALLLIIVFNLIRDPSFFGIKVMPPSDLELPVDVAFEDLSFFEQISKGGRLFGSVIDILKRAAPLMLVAIGMTLVIATEGVDLSVGPVMAISATMAAYLIGNSKEVSDTPLALVILAGVTIATLGGLWNGLLVSRVGLQPIVATLILMTAGRGVAQLISEGQILTIYYAPYYFIGQGYVLGIPFPLLLALGVLLLVWLFTRRTALGLFVESIGINSSASYYGGINEKNIKLLVYTLCGLCAGIAGLVISAEIHSADANRAGHLYELDAILAVVIGGTSMSGGRYSLVGSVLGALIIQSLMTSIYAAGVRASQIQVVKAIVILIVNLIQSEALRQMVFGRLLYSKGVAK